VEAAFGGQGGKPATDMCPAGQVLIGYVVYESASPAPSVVGKLRGLCGVVSVDSANCQVTISAGAMLPLHGAFSDMPPVTLSCPANQMVVGITGRAGANLDQIGFGCAPLLLSKVVATYQTSVGATTWLSTVGGPGGNAYQRVCPAGQVSTGADVHAGQVIDAFGLYCSAPVLVP
jgi:hypothetical protein